MKRLWFIPILLAMILTISLWSMAAIGSAADTTSEIIDQIVQAAEHNDREQAAKLTQQLEEEWQDACKLLGFFLYRGELDEIATKISQLRALAISGELDDCIVESRECVRLVEHLKERESFHAGVFLKANS